jgi:hypothetical protein
MRKSRRRNRRSQRRDWAHANDNPIGKAFNKATKYVVTGSLDRLEWDKSERICVVAEIRRLQASNGADLQVWGNLLSAEAPIGKVQQRERCQD